MLHINNLTYRIGNKLLLENSTVAIPDGHRVGLVGRNGAGKSTLLRLIMGELNYEAGSISIGKRERLGMVSQETPSGPVKLIEHVLAADKERRDLLQDAETETDPHRIAEIHTRLADIGAHSAEARAARILNGLGFDEAAQNRTLDEYSGGWKMRVALAAALFDQPDILLLDEPTNYLDLEGTIWLENFIQDYPYTVVLISHDRDMLNKACGAIMHLSQGKLSLYTGNYDDFERMRREQQQLLMASKAKQEAQRRHIQAFVDRFRYKASKAKQAQSRLKMLEKMEPIASIVEESTIAFDFPQPERLSPPIVTMENVSTGYDPMKPVLSNMTLRIDEDDRIALLGANGNGKSTFAKLLSDRLKAFEGSLRRSRKLGVGYFAQHQTDELKVDQTAFDHMADLMKDHPEARIRARLGGFGFSGEMADQKVSSLSGGEKARLLFALMSWHAPNLLILDEPTNHLDVDTRQALVQSINTYEGAVILISHDRHLIESCADRLWIVGQNTIQPYEGTMDDYARMLLDKARGRKAAKDADGTSKQNKQDARRQAAAARDGVKHLKKAIQLAETKIEKLNRQKELLERKLADPALYDAAPEKITQLSKELASVNSDLEATEEEWLVAHDIYETARENQ